MMSDNVQIVTKRNYVASSYYHRVFTVDVKKWIENQIYYAHKNCKTAFLVSCERVSYRWPVEIAAS